MQKPPNRLVARLREPVTVAIFTAALVTAVLAFALFAIWTGVPGAPSPQTGTAGQLTELTPTPRTINWPKTPAAATPPAAPVREVVPNSAQVPSINLAAEVPVMSAPTATTPAITAAPPTSSPEAATATAPPATPTPVPSATTVPPPTQTPEPTADPRFVANDRSAFAAFAVAPWNTSGDTLVYEAAQAMSEPLLLVPHTVQGGDFAIEAEIRVDGLAQAVCNQSFGLAAGSEATGQFFGGGVIYACGATSPAARITDVSNWTNGYDQDRQLARGAVNPGEDWRHYRFEVRGDEFRLLVDGKEIVTATEASLGEGFQSAKGGFWTQGVRLSVRNVKIFAL